MPLWNDHHRALLSRSRLNPVAGSVPRAPRKTALLAAAGHQHHHDQRREQKGEDQGGKDANWGACAVQGQALPADPAAAGGGLGERHVACRLSRHFIPILRPLTDANDPPVVPAEELTIFAATLAPHRSLSQRGFLLVMLVIGGISFASGAVFLAMGAWPVFGFFGLDVVLIYWAFRANFRAADA
eukprot:gene49526-60638_t